MRAEIFMAVVGWFLPLVKQQLLGFTPLLLPYSGYFISWPIVVSYGRFFLKEEDWLLRRQVF